MKNFTTELKQTIVLEPESSDQKLKILVPTQKIKKLADFFGGVFDTQKNYSCGGRVPPNKNFQVLAYKKGF